MADCRWSSISNRWTRIAGVLASILGVGLPGGAYALSIASISPGSTTDTSASTSGSGPVELDSGVLAFPQGTFRARAYADDSTGILRVYGFADEIQNGAYDSVPQPVAGGGGASLTGMFTLVGAGSDPVAISTALDFDGSFSGTNAGNILSAQIIATQMVGAGMNLWSSSLSFQQFGSMPVQTIPMAMKSLPGDWDGSFAAGTPTVFSSAPDSLHGRVVVPLVLSPGDTFSLQVDLSASSGAHGDGCAPMTYCGYYNGTADGYSTGHLSFALPDGYSLVESTGAFSNVPTVPVPEPESYALMLAGVAMLVARLGGRRGV